MYKPSSTYRIQFNKDFNFKSLNKIIPYLKKLGVDTLYASPIFAATPGSTHGYDTIDPLRINPEIGTEAELLAISNQLKKAGIGWLQDIVPNHMSFHPNNKWLMDVLEKGKQSAYATFFDVDFLKGDGRLMVPFLGEGLEEVVRTFAIQVNNIDGKFYLSYGDLNWPLNKSSSVKILKKDLKKINQDVAMLSDIIDVQFYRLCQWTETSHTINYRRFFTVNSLICINIQDGNVFDEYHKYIFELVGRGVFQGLRIDHIDGLYDPKQYLHRLKKKIGDEVYIVVEKILASGEQLPVDWECEGSTGYDFLAIVNNLFTNKAAKKQFDQLYKKVIGKSLNPQKLIHQKKTEILFEHMHGELNNLCDLFLQLNLMEGVAFDVRKLKSAIAEMLIQMPVYRYYDYKFPLVAENKAQIEKLLKPILQNKKTAYEGEVLNKIFFELPATKNLDYNKRLQQFYQRCMQFTGPLMAKGVEDTAMFTYNRFAGHTEVGDAPDAFGLGIEAFHHQMVERNKSLALSMNASSTHDTKKGEDVRSRLNVLTDIPEEWADLVEDLEAEVRFLQGKYPSFKWLHKNDFYLMIQMAIGSMPFMGVDDIILRLEQFVEKALREAKKRSEWADPNEAYEEDVKHFVKALLKKRSSSANYIQEFLGKITDFAIINSLSQLLLKFTCPGIPDLYQGTELWDLSLVDPDNRRPVDFKLRKDFLHVLDKGKPLAQLWEERCSGQIKLWLTKTLIHLRKNHALVFEKGEYIDLKVKGKYARHILSFARRNGNDWILVSIPLGLASLSKTQNTSANQIDWQDTQIILPKNAPLGWKNILTNKIGQKDFLNEGLLVSEIFKEIPIGILKLVPNNKERSAGILMHITSLPSAFGIGDMGKEAFRFVDFLSESRQRHWQILPLNPTKPENGHSPYSSNSAMAGNVLLISPESLLEDGLLNDSDIETSIQPLTGVIDFEKIEVLKLGLLGLAHQNFLKKTDQYLKNDYVSFCTTEMDWLDGFSVYSAIKRHHQNVDWFKWPQKFKHRDQKTILDFKQLYKSEIEEIKWQQFIFFRQWYKLRTYAKQRHIGIIGDLPFYLDYDSAEVWLQTEYFELDQSSLDLKKVAGVPPDYFNADGQLWGMPIFNWEAMKKNNYAWWTNRLRKNLERFDFLRLDHFRAFASYWEIPAGSENAKSGVWILGPGIQFFKIMEEELGVLPLIAEDLGEISDDVEALRDHFKFPGMKVIQFAFGKDSTGTPHAPHNYKSDNAFAYTGTHDNNTLKGWFKNELNPNLVKRIKAYTGIRVNEGNIHKVIARLCYATNAKTAILPIQDILGLDDDARMNVPGTNNKNWHWRMGKDALDEQVAKWLSLQTEIYGRGH